MNVFAKRRAIAGVNTMRLQPTLESVMTATTAMQVIVPGNQVKATAIRDHTRPVIMQVRSTRMIPAISGPVPIPISIMVAPIKAVPGIRMVPVA